MARYIVSLLLLFSALPVNAHLIIDNAWVREAPPRSKVLALFVEITNHADHATTIVGASSKQFEKVELHETTFKDGMMRMQQQHELPMGPHELVIFKPGGKHFMLFNPVRVFKAGDQINIKLHLEGGKKKSVRAIVRKQAFGNEMSGSDSAHQH